MTHPDYSQFSVREFVLDDYFRRWVLQPDEDVMLFWHTYMLKHPEQQATLDEAASLLLHLRASYDDLGAASQQRIWQVLDERFAQLTQSPTSLRSDGATPLRAEGPRLLGWWGVWRPARVAASLTGLLVLAGAVWYVLRPTDRVVHTHFGERVSVTLPDGSVVILNGNSSLTYPSEWPDGQPREVWLDGEAFFNVAKRTPVDATPVGATPVGATTLPAGQPNGPAQAVKFVTHTPGLDITVLGTQFNVNTRRGHTDVTLLEGHVRLSKPGDRRAIDLKPGEVASTSADAPTVAIRKEKPQLHTAWTQRQFAFESTPLGEIAQQLSDTYGLTVTFADSTLASRRFTGDLSSQNLETLLLVIAETYDLRIERTGNQVVFHRQ